MSIWGTGLIKGLVITMRNMRRGPITVQYPHERIELPERARWRVVPIYHEDGGPACTACGSCIRACPDDCLILNSTTNEDRSKHIDNFEYDMGACMMCGLCVEACPFAAIEMSHDYELAVYDPADLIVDLLHDVPAYQRKRATAADGDAPKPKPAPKPAESATESPSESPEKPIAEASGDVPAAGGPETEGGEDA